MKKTNKNIRIKNFKEVDIEIIFVKKFNNSHVSKVESEMFNRLLNNSELLLKLMRDNNFETLDIDD